MKGTEKKTSLLQHKVRAQVSRTEDSKDSRAKKLKKSF